MKKKNLGIVDNRSFLARLTVLLAPQDDLVAYKAREIVKSQEAKSENEPVAVADSDRAARFLGSI